MQQHITNFFNLNKKWLVIGLSLYVLSLLLNIWPILFLVAFCLLNAALLIYDRYVEIPIDIELSTFSAILMTLKFGIWWGIITAVATKLVSMINNQDFNRNCFVSIFGYVIAAVLASVLSNMNIVLLGIIISVVINIYTYFSFKFVMMMSDFESLGYSVTNIIFNIMLFIGFSEVIFRVISVIH
jgi:hypothetical protein